MRGKGQKTERRKKLMGITPAYAGKRPCSEPPTGRRWDHPRLCGEKVPAGSAYSIVRGSPPPMRGKADVVLNRIDRIGITPAYAGKRYHLISVCAVLQDHPRLCGEKVDIMKKVYR